MRKTKLKPKNLEAIADDYGVTARTVRTWRAKGAPLEDAAKLEEWLALNNQKTPIPPELRERMTNARIRLVEANAERVERENKVRSNELIPKADVTDFHSHLVGTIFFGELDRLASEFPASLKGKSELEIHAECQQQRDRIRQSLGDALSTWALKHARTEADKKA